MTAFRPTSRWRLRLAVTLLGLVASLLWAGAATAQDGGDNPYSSTTTTHGGGPTLDASCELSITQGPPGAHVTARVSRVPFGAEVRILFNGQEVGRGQAPAGAQSVGQPVLYGGTALPAQAGTVTVAIPFVVPDVPPGRYMVSAVGPDFVCLCHPEGGGFEVRSSSEVRGSQVGSGDRARSFGADGGFGPLPRTGVYVAALLVVAAALLLPGWAFILAARRRERSAERAARLAALDALESGDLAGARRE